MSDDLGTLGEILGLRLRLAQGAVTRHFTEHFGELGLTQKQISVLWLVDATLGIAQADLSRLLQMDRATTMAIVHQLEKRGLILRQRSSDDGRRLGLTLSEAGSAILSEARAAIAEHERWLHSRFTDREAAQLAALLGRIID